MKEIIPNTLAIIPARGGSKGLPRKNIRMLGDKPLIAYTIHAALNSPVERVVVSTDDEEIAAISRKYGAEVPFLRPADIAGDQASSLSVLRHGVEHMEQHEGMTVEHVIFLQPTSPFRTAEHLTEAMHQYMSSGKTSLIGITDVQEFHPYFMFRIEGQHDLKPLHDLDERPLRRQDLPSFYRINGAVYISKRSYYKGLGDAEAIFDWESLSGYVMDGPGSVDINDYIDFQRAELILEKQAGELE